jgi:hypothetical protein
MTNEKIPFVTIMMIILSLATVLSSGCLDNSSPYTGTFTITSLESNDGTYWHFPSTYHYTLKVSMDNGKPATVYATQYFVNRHPVGATFSESTIKLEDYNNHQILIFSSDTPDELRDEHPETQSEDGCPVGYTGNVIRVAYVTNYHDIPNDGAHYWAYYDPDGSSKSYLTLNQLMDHINSSEGKYRVDCIYPSFQVHDYWENDAGPMGGYDGEKLTTALPRMATMPVNFALNIPTVTTPIPTRTPLPNNPEPGYGCPGCPSNFMGFAKDMCSRNLIENATVSDGVNTLRCSELATDHKDGES